MNRGYQNEYDFVELFNNKFLSELDDNSKNFLSDLFGKVIDDSEPIRCWKNKMVQKTDIFIKYKNYIKNVSLKCGSSNSIHHEQIQEFERYLGNLGIPYKVIDKYTGYHYGYRKDENGMTDFSVSLSSSAENVSVAIAPLILLSLKTNALAYSPGISLNLRSQKPSA